jgi:hypothetical protein
VRDNHATIVAGKTPENTTQVTEIDPAGFIASVEVPMGVGRILANCS